MLICTTLYDAYSQEVSTVNTFYKEGMLKETYKIIGNDSSLIDGIYNMYDTLGNVMVTGILMKAKKMEFLKNIIQVGHYKAKQIMKII